MGDVIATVTFIQGEVIARAPDGSERVLQIGDEIREGEVVITSAGGRVEFDFVDGGFYVMTEDEELTASIELAQDTAPAEDEAVTDDEVVAEVLEALEGDEDLLEVLEDPAAGPGAGDAGGGRSFVQLARISELTDPLSFEFPRNETEAPVPDESLFTEVAGDEPASPEAIPEPSVVVTAAEDLQFLEGDGQNEVGQEVATAVGTDPLGEGLTYAITEGSEGEAFYAIDQDGNVTLTEAGAEHANAGNDLPSVDVTVTDGADRTADDDAPLPETIAGPTVDVTAEDGLQFLEGDGQNEVGQEVATAVGTDPLGEGLTYAITEGSEGEAFYAIDQDGNVTLTEAGAEHANAGNDLPSVDVTVTDGADRTADDDAPLPETIAGPSIDGLLESGDVTVDESNLADGRNPDADALTQSGVFTVTAVAGVASLKFAGEGFDRAIEVEDLLKSSSDPVEIITSKGVLTITDFSEQSDGSFEVSYSYTLTQTADHPDQGPDQLDKDDITVTLEDLTGREASDAVNVTIVDDIPVKASDTAELDLYTAAAGVGELSASFQNAVYKEPSGPTDPTAPPPVVDNDGDTISITWGSPAQNNPEFNDGSQRSSYAFTKNAGLAANPVEAGSVFEIGTFTHENFAMVSSQSYLDTVELEVAIGVLIDGVQQTVTTTIKLDHIKVPYERDENGNFVPQDDLIGISDESLFQEIEVNGKTYTFQMLGFTDANGELIPTGSQVATPEGGSTSLNLVGQIVPPEFSESVSGTITPDWGADGPADSPDLPDAIVWLDKDGNEVALENGAAQVQGAHGVLQVTEIAGGNGASPSYSYTYMADPSLQGETGELTDRFDYILTDGDGDAVDTNLTFEITAELFEFDAPRIDGLVESDDVTVNEANLADGTDPDSGALTQTGAFTVTAAAGVASLTFAGEGFGETVGVSDLLNASSDSVEITTSKGVLTITDFAEQPDGSFEVSYSYTLTETADHPEQGRDALDKDDITVTVEDLAGREASDSINVTIVDDVPELETRDVTFENSGEFLFQGTAVNMGADRAGAELLWTEPPEGLSAGGTSLHYEGIGTSTLTAYAGEDGDKVFELIGNPDGTYTFEQFNAIDLTTSESRDFTAGDFNKAGGPEPSIYILEDGSVTRENPGADNPWAVEISGIGGSGGNADQINSNSNGFGVGNPNFTSGESITFDFDIDGKSGDPDFFSSASIEFDADSGFEMDFTMVYSDGSEGSDTFTLSDLEDGTFTFNAPDGLFLDSILLENTGSSTQIIGFGVEEVVVDTVDEGVSFDIGFEAIDGDGDEQEGSIGFFAEPSETLDTSASDEGSILVGSSSGNILVGGQGDDIFYGGGGDDTFTGGGGNDLYIWQSGDQGSDTITDFGMAADEVNADTLDVSDLLTGWDGEESLTSYIEAEEVDGNTVIKISSSGNLETGADQEITLQGVTGYSADSDIIQAMIEAGQLKVDSESNG